MRCFSFLVVTALLMGGGSVLAQDSQEGSEAPAPAPPPAEVRHAMPRQAQPRVSPAEGAVRPEVRSQSPRRWPDTPSARQPNGTERDAIAAQSSPQRWPNEGQAAGGADDTRRRAVPRGARPPASPPAIVHAPPARVYAPRTYVYNYPRYSAAYRHRALGAYPYGYSTFGLGYFYYDPYAWPRSYPYVGAHAGSHGVGSAFGFDIGELRLRVSPRQGEVYVDGYYAGTVDDFDGAFQALKLESGPYHIEIAAPGYEALAFDIRITPGQKINYRGDLRRLP